MFYLLQGYPVFGFSLSFYSNNLESYRDFLSLLQIYTLYFGAPCITAKYIILNKTENRVDKVIPPCVKTNLLGFTKKCFGFLNCLI